MCLEIMNLIYLKNMLDLYKARDFGRYEDPIYKDVVISFITTNDITGGNSWKPSY